jgi:hypothetical protein
VDVLSLCLSIFDLNPALPGDLLQHSFDIAQHVSIGETNDPVMVLLQPFRPGLVVSLLLRLGVMCPIDLDHQLVLVAKEINDKAKDGMLPSKFEAVQLFASQPLPQFGFRLRQRSAQLSGPGQNEGMDMAGGFGRGHIGIPLADILWPVGPAARRMFGFLV